MASTLLVSLNHESKPNTLFGNHFWFWTEAFNKLAGVYNISLKNQAACR